MPPISTIAHPALPNTPDAPVALYAVDATGAGRPVTHGELAEQIDRAAAVMRRLGVRPGDRVALHLPLIPEAVVALLACTRIGAVATTLTPWTSLRHHPSDELTLRRLRRIRLLVTTDEQAPDAGRSAGSPTTASASQPVLVVRTSSDPIPRRGDGHQWWHRALAGTKPRPAHLAPAPEERIAALRLGLRGPTDVYWCAAGLDWLVRHPEAVAGPLALGSAQVLCEDVTRLPDTLRTFGVTVLHAHPDALHDVLWRFRLTDPDTPEAPGLRLVAPITDAASADADPGHWYWQREQCPTAAWQLRHGPSPWSPPLVGTPTNPRPAVPC